MKDRVPKYPGRYKVTYSNGSTAYVTVERADSPVSGNEGTPLNKESLLNDKACTLIGLGADSTPNDALIALCEEIDANKSVTKSVSLSSSGWSASGSKYIQTVSVTGVTSANTVIVSPAPASADVYAKASAYCSAQASGKLTFTSNSKIAASLNIIIL